MELTVRDHAFDAARPAVTVDPDATLRTVARQLWESNVGAAVVRGEATSIAGVISERDVVAQLAVGADPDEVTAAEAMSRNVVSAQPADPVLDIVFLMLDAGVRHIPVVEGDVDRLVGVVSMRDLLKPLLIDHFNGTPEGER
ncbi:MAG TPA: CBS domain-containing protein [Acidimicrobiales bacterium]